MAKALYTFFFAFILGVLSSFLFFSQFDNCHGMKLLMRTSRIDVVATLQAVLRGRRAHSTTIAEKRTALLRAPQVLALVFLLGSRTTSAARQISAQKESRQ